MRTDSELKLTTVKIYSTINELENIQNGLLKIWNYSYPCASEYINHISKNQLFHPAVTVILVLKEKSNPTLYRYSTFGILGTVSVFKSRVGTCKVFALKGWILLTLNLLTIWSDLIPLYIDGRQEPPLWFAWSNNTTSAWYQILYSHQDCGT